MKLEQGLVLLSFEYLQMVSSSSSANFILRKSDEERAVSKSTVEEVKIKWSLLVTEIYVRLLAGGNCYSSITDSKG